MEKSELKIAMQDYQLNESLLAEIVAEPGIDFEAYDLLASKSDKLLSTIAKIAKTKGIAVDPTSRESCLKSYMILSRSDI